MTNLRAHPGDSGSFKQDWNWKVHTAKEYATRMSLIGKKVWFQVFWKVNWMALDPTIARPLCQLCTPHRAARGALWKLITVMKFKAIFMAHFLLVQRVVTSESAREKTKKINLSKRKLCIAWYDEKITKRTLCLCTRQTSKLPIIINICLLPNQHCFTSELPWDASTPRVFQNLRAAERSE